MKPLTPDEARSALQKGQGRIVLHLQQNGADGLRDVILEACLRNQVYDAQVEGPRADWLMSMIDLTGDAKYFRQPVVDALAHSTDFREIAQLMDLALAFAQRGCEQARTALYQKFDAQLFNEDWLGGEQILALDGIDGMRHVAKVIGTRKLRDPEYWVHDGLLDEACVQLGAEAVMAALDECARSSPFIRAYLDGIASAREARAAAKGKPRAIRSLDAILADIDAAAGEYPGQYSGFGRHANAQDVEQVFERLLTESRREQLLRCLWVFTGRALPRLHGRLFELARSADPKLKWAAIRALSHAQDESIREVGIQLLRDDPAAVESGAIRLFRRNYRPGDASVIESALPCPDDLDRCHDACFDITDIAALHEDPQLAKCLEWIYEHSPCSNCRGKAVKELLKRDRASVTMLQEAAWDCCEDTRALARNALAANG